MASAGNAKRADAPGGRAFFPATHWTEIAAIRDPANAEAERALENLCRTYLPAIESYLRWFRSLPGDPHELANEFLAQFIHQDSLQRVDRARGKFRSYLAGAIRHFLNGRWRAQARTPELVELDESTPDAGADDGAVIELDRGFAEILVGNAVARTLARFAGSRVEGQIPVLLPYLSADPPAETLRSVAHRLGVSEDLVYQNLRRVREELFRQLRAETMRHLGPEDDVVEEMQALLRVYARTRA